MVNPQKPLRIQQILVKNKDVRGAKGTSTFRAGGNFGDGKILERFVCYMSMYLKSQPQAVSFGVLN